MTENNDQIETAPEELLEVELEVVSGGGGFLNGGGRQDPAPAG